jgi:DNA-binding NtrC family response regulator
MSERVRLLVVDDEAPFRQLLANRFTRRGHAVSAAATGEEALRFGAEQAFDVAILDLRLPDLDGLAVLGELKEMQPEIEVIMLTGQAGIDTAVEAMRRGAYDYRSKPCELADLEVLVGKAFEKAGLARQNWGLREALARRDPCLEIVGESRPIAALKDLIARVADSDSAVHILGERGAGKELVARAIHRASPRKGNPLVAVNCAALNESLLESELFGHAQGAFTGAVDPRPGLLEAADGGTLFLDEVGEMSAALQARLLRVLDLGEFHRVGDPRARRADFRLLSATNRDLRDAVQRGTFRKDLYSLLNVVTIRVPPLRERREDIPSLLTHFLRRHRAGRGEEGRVAPDVLALLTEYPWPGNVRELENVIERAVILATPGGPIEPAHFSEQIREWTRVGEPPSAAPRRRWGNWFRCR